MTPMTSTNRQSAYERVKIPPAMTAREVMAMFGLPESSAFRAVKQGYYCPGYCKNDYPQHDGPGGYAELYDAQGVITNLLARTVRRSGEHLTQDEFDDWVQDLLLVAWERRHFAVERSYVPYILVTLKSLIRQWLRRREREAEKAADFIRGVTRGEEA